LLTGGFRNWRFFSIHSWKLKGLKFGCAVIGVSG
jgi:hypothetical protein